MAKVLSLRGQERQACASSVGLSIDNVCKELEALQQKKGPHMLPYTCTCDM